MTREAWGGFVSSVCEDQSPSLAMEKENSIISQICPIISDYELGVWRF